MRQKTEGRNISVITDKIYGCLYGQAIGDALGLGSEFMNKEEVLIHYPSGLRKYEQIVQDEHRCRWAKGAWTDDTDMMLCIMDGVEQDAFNIPKIAQNFKDWFIGNPLGIGVHTYKVLCMRDYTERPEDCSKLWWEVSRQQSAANGALIRTSVVGLAKTQVSEQAEMICRLTHYDSRCVGACVIASVIIYNLVWNDRMLTFDEICTIGRAYDDRIQEWIELAYNSSDISMLDLDEPYSIGYTLRTLSSALWCYWHVTSFEDGLLQVVNEGGDADTNAAIACAILGAKYGYSSIPNYYIDNLHNRESFHSKVYTFVASLTEKKHRLIRKNSLYPYYTVNKHIICESVFQAQNTNLLTHNINLSSKTTSTRTSIEGSSLNNYLSTNG